PGARSTALKEADLVLVVGTRLNYVFGFGRPPRFSPKAKLVRIDIDPEEIAASGRLELGIVGDAGTVLRQVLAVLPGRVGAERFAPWLAHLAAIDGPRVAAQEETLANDSVPIHPLRL